MQYNLFGNLLYYMTKKIKTKKKQSYSANEILQMLDENLEKLENIKIQKKDTINITTKLQQLHSKIFQLKSKIL